MAMGDGMGEGVVFDKVVKLVAAAKAGGATIVCGGEAPSGPGNFYPLTLVTDIADGNPLVDEEQFGPVLPIIKHHHVEDAIGGAKGSGWGLEFGIDGLKAVTQPQVISLKSKGKP